MTAYFYQEEPNQGMTFEIEDTNLLLVLHTLYLIKNFPATGKIVFSRNVSEKNESPYFLCVLLTGPNQWETYRCQKLN